ncbi:MAG TPA: cytochrome c peroxidase [Pyrinomonadaceae bacterium]|nr:cytochrome c peroxidase [Pyrinomonadaceae bacterium]
MSFNAVTAPRFPRTTIYLLLLLIFATSVVALQRSDTRKQKVELGRALFFDKRLSEDRTVSCATCHDPASAFTSGDAVAVGVGEQKGTRNAPTLLNSVFSKSYFWDGRVATLEQQVKHPLLNANEMGMKNESALVERVAAIDEYRKGFRSVFPREGITIDTIATAIAAFERSLVSRDAPFDRFIRGDKNALSDLQKQGWELFKGKAKCIDCHLHTAGAPFFTDAKFHNTGVRAKQFTFEALSQQADKTKQVKTDLSALAHDPQFSDLGRFLVTRDRKDLGAFKTPTLRDVELTGPYMHDGSIRTLLDVLRFYNQGGAKNPLLDEKMAPLNLTEQEMNAIVEFLRALTSDEVLRLVQTSKPQTRTPVAVQTFKPH